MAEKGGAAASKPVRLFLYLASWIVVLSLLYAFVAQMYLDWRILIAYVVGILVLAIWVSHAEERSDRLKRLTFNVVLAGLMFTSALVFILVRAMNDVQAVADSFAMPWWVAPTAWYVLLAGCVILGGKLARDLLGRRAKKEK